MSEGHTHQDGIVDKTLTPLRNTSLLNRTKVVRLFVVTSERTKASIMANENPTRADVFVFSDEGGESTRDISRSAGGLKAMSLGKSDVVEHHEAHVQDPRGIVRLNGADGEQIEWQCDVPFRVVNIEQHVDDRFPDEGNPPEYPFARDLEDLREIEGDPCTPIRSGPVVSRKDKTPWKRLYKAHFELKIGGRWKPLDPDFYCGGPPN